MKKTLILTVLGFAIPFVAQAATIMITPTAPTVAVGQKITLTVSVNPTGKSIAAVEAYVSYPANILTADSFAYAGTWVPVTQGGYDQLGSGTVVKTAGYPGGLTSAAAFGTITFTAKAVGAATVAVDTAQSIAYDANTVNALSGAQGSATIHVTNGTAATATHSGAGNSNGTISHSSATSSDITAGTEATSSLSATTSTAQAAAAAITGAVGSTWWKWLLLIIGLILVITAGWNLLRRRK